MISTIENALLILTFLIAYVSLGHSGNMMPCLKGAIVIINFFMRYILHIIKLLRAQVEECCFPAFNNSFKLTLIDQYTWQLIEECCFPAFNNSWE